MRAEAMREPVVAEVDSPEGLSIGRTYFRYASLLVTALAEVPPQ